VEAVRRGDIEALVAQMDLAADDLAEGLVGVLIENINKVTESTGNVVDAGGAFTFEKFYEALEMIDWSLDDDDQLSMPQLVVHPDTAEKLQALPELTAEQKAALDDLKRRKHEELLARRRRRRLS